MLDQLPEHQSPKRDEDVRSEYEPSSEERALIRKGNKLFEKAKRHRSKYDANWLDNYKFFRGKQWKQSRPAYRHSEVINLVWQAIQSVVPIQTDARPKFEFLPQDPQDREFSEILNQIAQSDWEKNNWSMELTATIYDANIYGTGYGSMCVDQEKLSEFQSGVIEHESEDPFYLYPDPNARNVNKKSRYFIKAEPMELYEIKKKWPEKGKFVKPDLNQTDDQDPDKTQLHNIVFRSPVDNQTMIEGERHNMDDMRDRALVITVWLHDDSIVEEKKENQVQIASEDGLTQTQTEVLFEQRKQFPNGRKFVFASNVLLEDGPNPYEDGLFPYARLQNYMLPREFFGVSEIEQLESPQMIFNKLISFALDVLTLMGNPIWIVDNDSDVETDNLFNRPGMVVEKNSGSEVRREEGVQLQPYVLQLIDRLGTWFDGISGANDVTRGIRPEGVTAARAIENLMDASQTRLRLKARLLDAYLQELGQLYLSRVLQYRTAPEIIRLTNNQNAQKYFKFRVSQNEEGQRVAYVTPMVQTETGDEVFGEEKAYPIQGSFDVRVQTASSLPFAKVEKFQQAKEMFQLGAIDLQELLKAADWPSWEAVLDRMQAQQAQAAQAQAAEQGVAPPAA